VKRVGLVLSVTAAWIGIAASMAAKIPASGAGPRTVDATFVQKSPVQTTVRLLPYRRSSADTFDASSRPHLQTVTIGGPYNPDPDGTTALVLAIINAHYDTAKVRVETGRRAVLRS
jgi:hypothetical protein